jgi:two-component system chemotaxis response regulator CheB
VRKYGVLVVDDSAFMRRAVGLLVERDPAFFVAGIARNGLEALDKLRRLAPDVVTMDVEMPGMDGLQALEHIMREHPVPVVMLSSKTGAGTQATIRALELGAVDFFPKESLISDAPDEGTLRDFHTRLKIAATAKVAGVMPAAGPAGTAEPPASGPSGQVRLAGPAGSAEPGSAAQAGSAGPAGLDAPAWTGPASRGGAGSGAPAYDLLVIGCSTGGPSALQAILPRFPADYPAAMIVVQHMPPGFTAALAERFNTICGLRVKEAEEGDPLVPGTIYFAPSGYQTTARRLADGRVVLHVDEKPDLLYRPSVDVTLRSAAPIYRNRMLAVVLTGMGQDGLEGCRQVKANGGLVLTESEESCVVYGMPKAVHEAGLSDAQAALPAMFSGIMSFL